MLGALSLPGLSWARLAVLPCILPESNVGFFSVRLLEEAGNSFSGCLLKPSDHSLWSF